MNRAQAYCRHRLDGHSVGDAAERAGYSGCPGPKARALYVRVESLNTAYSSGSTPSLEGRLATLEAQFEKLRLEIEDARQWLEASRVVDEHRRR